MATLYYYNFKNYYYPSTKRFSDLSGYQPYLVYSESGNNLNFYENDGVNAEIKAGRSGNPYYDKANYIIYSRDNISITSRWYVIEATKNASGQYNLQLHRDLPVDYYDEWTQSDCFIEKATLPENSPFIYNQEDITTNQIKTNEIPLKDSTKMAWICGFLDKKYSGSTEPIKFKSEVKADSTIHTYDFYNQNIPLPLGAFKTTDTYLYVYTYNPYNGNYTKWQISDSWATDFKATDDDISRLGLTTSIATCNTSGIENFKSVLSSKRAEILSNTKQYKTLYGVHADSPYVQDLINDSGKIFEESSNVYYKLERVTPVTTSLQAQSIKITEDKAGQYMYTYLNNIINSIKTGGGNAVYEIDNIGQGYIPVWTRVYDGEYTVSIPKYGERLTNRSGPFDMFCIPYSDEFEINVTNVTNGKIQCNKQFAMTLAQAIGTELGSGEQKFLFDLQLLPFCPFSSVPKFVGDVLTFSDQPSARYTVVNDKDSKPIYYLFWSNVSSGTFNITDYQFNVDNKKLSNQVDMMRLVSPNFSSQFEFSPAKNNGISYFNVDFTYLPYSSYIHVNPDFKGLYKEDYNDSRGLIFQGDFSVMYLSDAWEAYQTSNKNYLEVFNRDVQNLETNYKYQHIQSGISSVVSAITSGLAVGGLVNGGAGIGTGLASAVGGVADMSIQQALHNEQLDYKRDMFGYQLDNIKALPNSIAKSTAYTENNKIFPILEYYTCTDEEKEAVAKKIAFNGMSVGVIDKPIRYIGNNWSYKDIQDKGYIKCKLIKLEGTQANDFHLVNMLGDELNKGVYTK